jgi:hypothetical protein
VPPGRRQGKGGERKGAGQRRGVLEAGTEGAVKAVKVSAKLVTGHHSDDEDVPEAASDAQPEAAKRS